MSRTRATLRSAELGFFGVVVYTRVHTPRRCGLPFSAGVLVLLVFAWRPLRTNCWIVGTGFLSPSGRRWDGRALPLRTACVVLGATWSCRFGYRRLVVFPLVGEVAVRPPRSGVSPDSRPGAPYGAPAFTPPPSASGRSLSSESSDRSARTHAGP